MGESGLLTWLVEDLPTLIKHSLERRTYLEWISYGEEPTLNASGSTQSAGNQGQLKRMMKKAHGRKLSLSAA